MQNREMFIDQVNDMLRDAPDEDYVMILSDIADFKIINDIYGREAGDRILLGIAGSIRALANERSLFCRWGGDQFAAFARKELPV
jgi:diguanylate cyclase (GGDEF)-like protein